MGRRPGRVATQAALCIAIAVPALAARIAPVAGAADGTRGKVAAFGLSRPGSPPELQNLELPRVKNTGATSVAIDAWWDVDTSNGSLLHPGAITATDAQLTGAMDTARRAGLNVIFTPKLWCPLCQAVNGYTWRGRLNPTDRPAFFGAYRTMINHYASLANAHGVKIFFIGSEYERLQDAADEWRAVASDVRARFAGKIAYEVNWDVWDRVGFWDAVDIVGVSAYFPLSDAQQPSVAELKAAWHDSAAAKFLHHTWFDNLAELHRVSKKPVLFGELGYPSMQYAARAPYDATQMHSADVEVQKNAYQAALETFEPQSWWLGVIWWEWFVSGGGPTDTSYSPRDKPAEKFLSSWYHGH
jgi:hypothetical protein